MKIIKKLVKISKPNAPVAQRIERMVAVHKVAGSIPAGRAKQIDIEGGGMPELVEWAALEMRYGPCAHRGFESLFHRHFGFIKPKLLRKPF